MSETNRSDSPDARRARQRPPDTYDSVSAWYADYQGFVPLPMAHALSRLTASGMSFPDAYRTLLEQGRIIEIEPPAAAEVDRGT
jgi:hypothetical protein